MVKTFDPSKRIRMEVEGLSNALPACCKTFRLHTASLIKTLVVVWCISVGFQLPGVGVKKEKVMYVPSERNIRDSLPQAVSPWRTHYVTSQLKTSESSWVTSQLKTSCFSWVRLFWTQSGQTWAGNANRFPNVRLILRLHHLVKPLKTAGASVSSCHKMVTQNGMAL